MGDIFRWLRCTDGVGGGTHAFADGAQFSGAGRFDGGGVLRIDGHTQGLRIAEGTTVDLNLLALSGSGMLTNAGTVTARSLGLPGDKS